MRRRRYFPFAPAQGPQNAWFPGSVRQTLRRWPPLIRRGRFLNPGWGQSNQGSAYPTFGDPAGFRPRWAPYLRRGRYVQPPWPQGTLGVNFPSFIDQAGSRPRWGPYIRRGRFAEPAWPQSNQGAAYPTVTTQAGARPRWQPLIKRGHFREPPWPQGPQTVPYPTFTDPAGGRPRWGPYLRRGRFAQPPWPQGQLGINFPTFVDPAGSRPRWQPPAKRSTGRTFQPPWTPPVIGYPTFTTQAGPRPRWHPFTKRGRYVQPPWPQAQLGANYPTFIVPAAKARPQPTRRGRIFGLPQVPLSVVIPQFLRATARRLIPTRRGRYATYPWVQPWVPPNLTRRPRPATPSRVRRRFSEPAWPQGPLGRWLPVHLIPRRPPSRGRRSTSFAPPWPQSGLGQRNLVLTVKPPILKWLLQELAIFRWVFGNAALKWAIGGPTVPTIPVVSLEYVRVQVTATVAGQTINPTGDTVKMAFLSSATAEPAAPDWKAATWDSDTVTGRYFAQCLVGPGGTVTLTAGLWYVWIQIADNPEIPARQAGTLTVV